MAGCPSVVMTTPPGKDGEVNPNILAAAYVSGVKEIYKVGGAQGIAMLAYGTETVEPVFKIAGPARPSSLWPSASSLAPSAST